MIIISHQIEPALPPDDERMSICGLFWVSYLLSLALVLARLA